MAKVLETCILSMCACGGPEAGSLAYRKLWYEARHTEDRQRGAEIPRGGGRPGEEITAVGILLYCILKYLEQPAFSVVGKKSLLTRICALQVQETQQWDAEMLRVTMFSEDLWPRVRRYMHSC